MSVRLNGSTSGYTEINAPAVAANNTLTLPTSNGSAGQTLNTDGAGNLSFGSSIVTGTAQNSTSGTAIDFTGIPSWVKRITVMFNGVSTSGTSIIQVQVGSGSFSNLNYLSSCGAINGGTGQAGSTTGIAVTTGLASASNFSGFLTLSLFSSNTWVASGNSQYNSSVGAIFMSAGYTPALSGTLDRVRITTVNGTDTFDAGSINILYE